MAVDSPARRVIVYLQGTLPADLLDTLHFDALARRGHHLPVCVITPTPSLPELRAGGRVEKDVRSMKIRLTLWWNGDETGRNHDEFAEAVDVLIDTLYEMRGTATLGTNVLQSSCTLDDVTMTYDVEAVAMIADIDMLVKFIK